MALASVSVDLDGLELYERIHGLPESAAALSSKLVGVVAVERLMDIFTRVGIRPTLFVVASSLEDNPATIAALATAHGLGAELANHSWAHDYALTQRSLDDIRNDVRTAHGALERLLGITPRGFRAPGYTINAGLLTVLRDAGYAYDASVFPAAPYWLAKAAVMGAMRALGRRTHAILDTPGVLLAPRMPYVPDVRNPYRSRAATDPSRDLLELPITVERHTRLPFIGTVVTSLPPRVLDVAHRSWRQDRFVQLGLHALDVLGPEDGLPPSLLRHQPDARLPVRTKLERLERVLHRLVSDFEVVPLIEAAERFRTRTNDDTGSPRSAS